MNKTSQLLKLPFAGGLLARACGSALILFATVLCQGQALPPVETTPDGQRYRAGEVLVQFKGDVTDQQVAGAFQQGRLGLIKHIQTPAMKAHGRIGITRTATVLSVPEAVRRLNQLPGVEFAEPDWVATQQFESNDPLYLNGYLWGMFSDDATGATGPAATYNLFGSQAEKAWAAGFIGSPEIYVGVIDGGLQLDHPDLAANIWTNPGEIAGNGLDDDGDGYVDDLHGWNAVDDNGNVSFIDATDAHATHVAGTIGAVGGNGLGVAGVNWNVTLISGKIFPGGYYSDIIQAIDYMTNLKTRKGLNIVAVNCSFGGPSFSQALLDAYTRAAKAGIISVVAAMNSATNIDLAPAYPAAFNTTASAGYDAIISVAAIQSDGALASFSNYGQKSVDLAAPGVGVLSTVPFATPTVMVGGDSYLAGQIQNAAPGTASAELVDGGKALSPDANWAGKVVLVERGDVTFLIKVMNVQNAGGLAAVIYNNVPGSFAGSLLSATSAIPAVSISREDGLLLQGKLGLSATVVSPAPGTPGSSYAYFDGTSMATPHVTGAIALYASTHPGSTPAQTRHDLLTAGVRPLAALQGFTVTGGTLDIGTLMTVPTNTLAAPAAPTTLKATATSGTRVDLSWTDRSNNELGFDLERSTDGVTYFLADTVGANHVTYSDLTVQPGHTYFYRVRAYNPGGSSAYAPSASVATPAVTLPKAPSSLTATALSAGSGVSLAWKDNSSNEDGFQIERKTGSTWQVLTTMAANTKTFKDASAARRTTYTYRVLAFNVAGGSPYSNQVSVTTK
jgi:thermitase